MPRTRLRPITPIQHCGVLSFPTRKVVGTNQFGIRFTALEGTVFTRSGDTEETNNG
jgi:hypothetical protein